MAKAYLVARITIRDPEQYEAYRSRTREIIEFPDVEAAQLFYDCADYQQLVPHRTNNSEGVLLIAEGAEA